MKSIIKELEQNKGIAEEKGKAWAILQETAHIRAREILEKSIRQVGYDPSEVYARSDRVLAGKKETTVRFYLSPRGYVHYPVYEYPTVLVHLKPDGTGYIAQGTLLRILPLLTRPDFWKKGHRVENET
jgi:hypothetical protein